MAEQVVQSRTETRPIMYYDSARNPFSPTITTCGCRACTKCAGTGNSNFMLSDESHICETCKGTKKETYFETKPNPYYGKTYDEIEGIIRAYQYKKQVEEISRYLMDVEELDKETVNIYKKAIDTYEKLGGDNPLIQICKSHIERLNTANRYKSFYLKLQQDIKSNPEKMTQQVVINKQASINKIKEIYGPTISPIIKRYLDQSLNILKEIEESFMKKAIDNPVPVGTFTPKSPTQFDHIPNLNKGSGHVLTVKPVKFNEWVSLYESDNGGFVDIMGRHGEMWDRAMQEQDKIRWMRQFAKQYREYATHCKSVGVKPDPIPSVDVLNRRLEYITLEDGERIYNTHYDPPGCVIM